MTAWNRFVDFLLQHWDVFSTIILVSLLVVFVAFIIFFLFVKILPAYRFFNKRK